MKKALPDMSKKNVADEDIPVCESEESREGDPDDKEIDQGYTAGIGPENLLIRSRNDN